MKKFKGTLGPWEKCGWYVYGKDENGHDKIVADCRPDFGFGPTRVETEETALRNQTAITAVQELIEALIDTREALSMFENYQIWGDGDPKLNKIRKKTYHALYVSKVALSKALGD